MMGNKYVNQMKNHQNHHNNNNNIFKIMIDFVICVIYIFKSVAIYIYKYTLCILILFRINLAFTIDISYIQTKYIEIYFYIFVN
jgi:hypothetical protein